MQEFKINLTDSAISKVKTLIEDINAEKFRISLIGGGCSGISYKFSIDTNVNDTDLSMQIDGLTVIVDKKSALFISGSTIDWQDTLMNKSFKVSNPLKKSECSCGKSFSV